VTLYQPKSLDFGFIILTPDNNPALLKYTVNSIKRNYPNQSHLCVVGDSINPDVLKELKIISPVVKGRDTITSLINAGMKKGHKGWNVIVMCGCWVHGGLDRKFSYFLESEKDVIFPIIANYNREGKPVEIFSNFMDCTLNGILIHQKTFKEVGDMTDDSLEKSRMMWAATAIDMGCKFKSVLGVKII